MLNYSESIYIECYLLLQKLLSYLFPKRSAYHYTDHTNWVSVFSGALFTLLSVSRIIAVYQGEICACV